jgi:hypothetical protein
MLLKEIISYFDSRPMRIIPGSRRYTLIDNIDIYLCILYSDHSAMI